MSLQRRTGQTQLPLPFQPSVTAGLTPDERDDVRKALAQLLLSAAGRGPEETSDER